jgi:hypothetical protein
MNPLEPEGKCPVAPSPTYKYGSHAPTFSRVTKRDSSYNQLSEIPILTSGKSSRSIFKSSFSTPQ